MVCITLIMAKLRRQSEPTHVVGVYRMGWLRGGSDHDKYNKVYPSSAWGMHTGRVVKRDGFPDFNSLPAVTNGPAHSLALCGQLNSLRLLPPNAAKERQRRLSAYSVQKGTIQKIGQSAPQNKTMDGPKSPTLV